MSMAIGDSVLNGPSGAELVLSSLSQKQSTGGELTGAEILMGMTAATNQMSNHFGPSPRDMEAPEAFMPESLKGALASARV